MAYAKLLLNAGGGIISIDQQSAQVRNIASIFIGLGGTGIDCIRTIKTQVYTRLKPDNPDDTVPQYSRIRFLGVDSDRASIESAANIRMPLDEVTEFLDISNPYVVGCIVDECTSRLRPEMSWVNPRMHLPDAGASGAGAIRQIGRYMLMDKADGFMNKVQAAINGAREGLNVPAVHIHICAGIGGGTGSGTFLDVCYMIRKLTECMNNVKVFGYFFLPDVNINRIGPNGGVAVNSMLKRNGYAAMQELDYCMGFPENGGSFTQIYKGGRNIAWDCPPVDICHLVCGQDMEGSLPADPYNYAMNATAEYAMDILTEPVVETFSLSPSFSGFHKTAGVGRGYCIIGGASASVPIREINTYLMSELFEKFSGLVYAEPTEADVNALAVSSLGLGIREMSGLYQSLLDELSKDAEIGNFAYYVEDHRYALQDERSFVEHYANQLAEKRNLLERNAQSMMDADNTASLIGRLRKGLETVICDINRGPIFAHRMLKAENPHSMVNLVCGLMECNRKRLDQQLCAKDDIRKNYEDTRRMFVEQFRRSLFDNDKKRFAEYEWATQEEVRSQIQIDAYIKLGEVLEKLSKQVQEYYKLAKVMKNLLETFAQNRADLREGTYARLDSFNLPLVTIDEIRDILDDEVQGMNIPDMMAAFTRKLMDSESEWFQEDEDKIAKVVISFFERDAFPNFSNRSIHQFLQDKYRRELGTKLDNVQLLASYIYRDWIKLLTRKASPLFIIDYSMLDFNDQSGQSYISVPEACPAISMAVEGMLRANNAWNEKQSANADRIVAISSRYLLPIAAYRLQKNFGEDYFYADINGVHLYEGGSVPGLEFADWRQLPPLTPDCCITDLAEEPARVQEIVGKARELYREAENRGLIDDDGWILRPAPEALGHLRDAVKRCEFNENTTPEEAESALRELRAVCAVPLVRSGFCLQQDGLKTPENPKRVRQDYFVASPNFQIRVEKTLAELEEIAGAERVLAVRSI